MLGDALSCRAADQQSWSGSGAHRDVVREAGGRFHGKHNGRRPLVLYGVGWVLLKVRRFLRLTARTRVVVLVDDDVVVVMVTDFRLRGERGVRAQVPVLFLGGGGGGGVGGGATGLVFGVVERDPVLLLRLCGGTDGGLLGRLGARGGRGASAGVGVAIGQHGGTPPLSLVGGVAGVHVALAASLRPAAQMGTNSP